MSAMIIHQVISSLVSLLLLDRNCTCPTFPDKLEFLSCPCSYLVEQTLPAATVLAQNLKQFNKALTNTDLSYAILGKL